MVTTFPDIAQPDLAPPPQGTGEWYVVLFTPREHRAALVAALACRRELAGIARRSSDHGVAKVRLAWWREEITLLGDGRPRHPATRHLADAVADPAPAARPLGDMLAAANRELSPLSFANLADLRAHCSADGGAFFELIARVTDASALSADAVRALRQLGTGARLVEIIRAFHQDTVNGRDFLPTELVRELGVRTDGLGSAPPDEELRKVLSRIARTAREDFRQGLRRLPADERVRCAAALSFTALQAKLLCRIERRRFAVIGHWTTLADMTKLATAWNAARRSLRGQPPKLAGIET
jgi:phytoene synthase